MNIWPFAKNVSIRSELPHYEIKKRLEKELASRTSVKYDQNSNRLGWHFDGGLEDSRFSAGSRAEGKYKGNYQIVQGHFEKDGSGTIINLRFSSSGVEWLSIVFLVVLFNKFYSCFSCLPTSGEAVLLSVILIAFLFSYVVMRNLRKRILDRLYEIAEIDNQLNDSDIAVRKRDE